MTVILLILICLAALFSILNANLLHGVLALSALSLFSAMLFFILRAPDVAITEAAVGAGVSTVIFVWALKSTIRRQ